MSKKIKYNWNELLAEYLAGDEPEVKSFFISKYNHFNASMAKAGRGWPDKKKAQEKRIAERMSKALEDKAVKENTAALNNILTGFKMHLKDSTEIKRLTMKDKRIIWEVFRTELGMPTRVTFQKNENLNFDAGSVKAGLLDKIKDKLKK